MRGLILRLDGERQRFDRAHVQVRHLFHMPLLILQFAQIEPIRAINQVRHRKDQQEVCQSVNLCSQHISPTTPAPTR